MFQPLFQKVPPQPYSTHAHNTYINHALYFILKAWPNLTTEAYFIHGAKCFTLVVSFLLLSCEMKALKCLPLLHYVPFDKLIRHDTTEVEKRNTL